MGDEGFDFAVVEYIQIATGFVMKTPLAHRQKSIRRAGKPARLRSREMPLRVMSIRGISRRTAVKVGSTNFGETSKSLRKLYK
jgi:hypothetical protein